MTDRARSPARVPFRAPAPPQGAQIDWPEDFGTRFFLTVDTEEEFDWSAPFSREARSVTAIGAMPSAARRFSDLGASLTALIDHPVATDPAAVDHLRRSVADSSVEIGSQLHPWVTPPYREQLNVFNSFAGNLPVETEERKLAALTDAVTASFGAPRIYRAGRYGLGPNTVGLLARRGYRVDTSVRAHYDYSADGGPDFTAVGNGAYRAGEIVEVPLTTMFTGALSGVGPGIYSATAQWPVVTGAMARTGLLSRVGLTPEDMPARDAVRAIDAALATDMRLLVLSFHSPSLVPGHTPYVRDAADLAAFWRWWDEVMAALAQRSVRDVSCEQLIAALA